MVRAEARCPLCGASLPSRLARCGPCLAAEVLPVGTTLGAGTYILGSLLGWGDTGVTYSARQPGLDREVAVKELLPVGARRNGAGEVEALGLAAELAAFMQEARARVAVPQPGVVTLLDAFEANGTAYAVMERLNGEALSARAARAPMPLAEAKAIGRRAAGALAALHEAGRAHGDVRPEHLFLDVARGPIWIDPGATARGGTDDPLASRRYRPEGGVSAQAADVFGLAVCLAEVLPGGRASAPLRRALARVQARAGEDAPGALRELRIACGEQLAEQAAAARRPAAFPMLRRLAALALGVYALVLGSQALLLPFDWRNANSDGKGAVVSMTLFVVLIAYFMARAAFKLWPRSGARS